MLWGADWWDAFTALGTVSAVVTAILISLFDSWRNRKALRREREKSQERTATLVSAWVETEYSPADNGTRYDKRTLLKVANESDEPVYNVFVDVALQEPFRQVGPLAVPTPIPTLAPRTLREWDVSPGLLPHEVSAGGYSFREPVARIIFSDPRKQRWQRDYSGVLEKFVSETSKSSSQLDSENDLQIGETSALNPLFVAMVFIASLQEEDGPNFKILRETLDPLAPGWKKMSEAEWTEFAAEMPQYAMPSHVWYRTPRVAYVRLISEAERLQTEATGEAHYPMEILTLVFRGALGWTVFSFGPTSPEWIRFTAGETLQPIKSYLDEDPESN